VRVSFSKGVFISALYRDSRSSLFASCRVFDKRLGGFDPRAERKGEGGERERERKMEEEEKEMDVNSSRSKINNRFKNEFSLCALHNKCI